MTDEAGLAHYIAMERERAGMKRQAEAEAKAEREMRMAKGEAGARRLLAEFVASVPRDRMPPETFSVGRYNKVTKTTGLFRRSQLINWEWQPTGQEILGWLLRVATGHYEDLREGLIVDTAGRMWAFAGPTYGPCHRNHLDSAREMTNVGADPDLVFPDFTAEKDGTIRCHPRGPNSKDLGHLLAEYIATEGFVDPRAY